jgi:metal-responsive CopG/Arc/MetJ family transcriptional regulator
MSQTRTRSSRVFTISFPDALARQVEEVAAEEDRNISELFREAFRLYKLQLLDRRLAAARKAAPPVTAKLTQEDIEGFVDEVRHGRHDRKSA